MSHTNPADVIQDFKPLPSNPAMLTAEHAKTAFGGDVLRTLQEIVQLSRKEHLAPAAVTVSA